MNRVYSSVYAPKLLQGSCSQAALFATQASPQSPGREADPAELERLKAFVADQRKVFSTGEAAESAGRVAGGAARHTAPDEAAAWVVTSSVVMNLHEFITRD